MRWLQGREKTLLLLTNLCKMRKCCIEKEYDSCIECTDFPCRELQFELDNVPDARDNLEKLKK